MLSHSEQESDPNPHLTRQLVRAGTKAALSTSLAQDGKRPFVSLVLVGTTQEGEPLLLLSDLAIHTQNIAADNKVALLFDETDGDSDPLSGNRVSVLGSAIHEQRDDVCERFLRRHDHARRYRAFADFKMYRVQIESAHLVAGFGVIRWLSGNDLTVTVAEGLASSEETLLAELNALHRLWKLPGHPDAAPWTLIGVDSEGADFRCQTTVERVTFETRAGDAHAIRERLKAFAAQ